MFPTYPTEEYPHIAYDQKKMDSGDYSVQPLDDWVPGEEPPWEPIAGGSDNDGLCGWQPCVTIEEAQKLLHVNASAAVEQVAVS